MNELSSIDIDNFTEIYSDLKYFEQKTGRKFLEPFEVRKTYKMQLFFYSHHVGKCHEGRRS